MAREFDRKLVLEDGQEYFGYGFGANCDSVAEIVFNTAMIGYQEIISDSSYTYQMVVMTYPLIGNYGIADEDFESKIPTIGGLIVREYNDSPSNFRYSKTLAAFLEENDIPAISGLDTRELTRHIRDNGSMKALITDATTTKEQALKILAMTEIPSDAISMVSSKKKWYARTSNHEYNVVAIDCGIKQSMIKTLKSIGCNVSVVPWNATAEDVLEIQPDGIFVSNGPGSPADATATVELVKKLKGTCPIFGVALGQQIIALAYGASVYKMKEGHRGSNHAVKNLKTGHIEVVTQNHGFAVDEESLKGTGLEVTHINVYDKTVEGIACEKDKVFGVQYYPDNLTGPKNSPSMYTIFTDMMKEGK